MPAELIISIVAIGLVVCLFALIEAFCYFQSWEFKKKYQRFKDRIIKRINK